MSIDKSQTNPGQHRKPVDGSDIAALETRARELAAQAAALGRAATKARQRARQLDKERAAAAFRALRQPRDPGNPRSVRKCLLITPELVVRCSEFCATHALSFNGLVEAAILEYMEAHQ